MTQLTPHLCVADARAAIEWVRRRAGCGGTYGSIIMNGRRVGHCELAIERRGA
jgi:hypothetical protein